MPASTLTGSELDDAYFGDRDLLQVLLDLRRREGRVTFSSVAVAGGGGSRVELERPVLVLTGLRSITSAPSTSRPETIVLTWRLSSTSSDRATAEFTLIGDPEPVTVRFECEGIHLEVPPPRGPRNPAPND